MNKPDGYVIYTLDGGPLAIYDEPGHPAGLLWNHVEGTIFKDVASAKKAIAKTKKYAEKKQYLWNSHLYIKAVRFQ